MDQVDEIVNHGLVIFTSAHAKTMFYLLDEHEWIFSGNITQWNFSIRECSCPD